MWEQDAARWAVPSISSGLRELLADDAAHLADLPHSTDQVLLHSHLIVPPIIKMEKRGGLESAAGAAPHFALLSHRDGQVLGESTLHV